MKKILCLGNALVDVLVKIDDEIILQELGLPKGSMQLVDLDKSNALIEGLGNITKSLASGGAAGNTARGLGKLGIPVAYLGKVHPDEFGQLYRDDMMSHAVHPMLLEGLQPTGRALAFISPDSERTFATCLGAAVELVEDDLTLDSFKDVSILMIEGYLVFNHSLMMKAGKLAKELGIKVALDMASYNVVEANKDFLADYIKNYVDIVFANEEEALALTGLYEEEALRKIAADCEIAVVKIGSRGSLIARNNEITRIAPLQAVSKDTTGAGDLYASGFLSGYYHGKNMETCGKMGSLLAGNVIEVIGTTMSEERWNNILSVYKGLFE
ncbi:MAG: adenosine kinase [Bacteroidetes bacterium HGW-Bacteroidetes-21]|nr:MAG: adenosine kinase [Bacteroidetes bacterium HGW-Bacteroidetes-21]